MAINQILNEILKALKGYKSLKNPFKTNIVLSKSLFFYFFLASLFFLIFVIIMNSINQNSLKQSENLNSIYKTEEFFNLSNFFLSKINSPYKEINYTIQNNDSIEKILRKFEVNNNDIIQITKNLKEKNLTNISSGRELSLIIKNLDDKSKTVVHIIYPVNNTTSIEIR